MGLIKTCFKLMVGGVCGAYLAQNYQIPNIKQLATSGFVNPPNPQPKIKINDFGQDVPQNKT